MINCATNNIVIFLMKTLPENLSPEVVAVENRLMMILSNIIIIIFKFYFYCYHLFLCSQSMPAA